jgi:DEAD/DEAH box helicase domain-containing protein
MLSLQQAIEVKESLLAYLRATFSFQDKRVDKAFFEFIQHPNEGMFKGPYVSLKLPFVKASSTEVSNVPMDIRPDWLPYDHQLRSWYRLSSAEGHAPEPTIVTTGTGSGKTESFLFPLLDYCYQHLDRPGIKAIILYPMNALASDQAKRLAQAIHADERLRGKVTGGLFVGEGKNAGKYPTTMGPDHLIENRETILSSPPDILLTNFKMLDYGLMRATYHDLWGLNLRDVNLLRFLVLDELHTYDGAQGTDVANLIRRLKLKLNLPPGQLVPVGTSATIGSGEEAPALLAEYASRVFGETIGPEAIITENRINEAVFFDRSLDEFLPRVQKLKETTVVPNETYADFVNRQIRLWTLEADQLASDLRRLQIVRDLVVVCNEGPGIKTLAEIERRLSEVNPKYRVLPQWDANGQFSPKQAVLESLLALIAEAREGPRRMPFLYTQVQLWIREMSGLLRSLTDMPQFTWRDTVEANHEQPLALPPWFCRECGGSGWLGVKHDNKERFETDINDVYQKFFSHHKHIHFVNDASWLSQEDFQNTGYIPTDAPRRYVSGQTLEFSTGAGPGKVEVLAVRKLDDRGKNEHICPECNTRNTVAIIGTRVATMSSIAISQTLSTELDPLPEKDRKVLAFTNSVQDAAHQAGFVEARNYNFSFRSSLQKIISEQAEPISLEQLAARFVTYWKENADETGQHPLEAYYYRFYPKDYLGKSSPADYREGGTFTTDFQKEFDVRMYWETFSEFGYNATIGRTLEKTGSSAVFVPRESIRAVWNALLPWLDANGLLSALTPESFESFVHLLLYRTRVRGGISHAFLAKFRQGSYNLWELNWQRDSRHFLNKRFGPGSRFPRLLTTQRDSRGLLDSTQTRTSNWYHAHYRKSFPMAPPYVDIVNELYEKLLECLAGAGVLEKKEALGIPNYTLRPTQVYASRHVTLLECDSCTHAVYTGDDGATLAGGSCLTYRCKGHYAIQPQGVPNNYYQLVYNRNRSPRIYAADHTGLLERSKREQLEREFKNRTKFNSRNVMVATSTLEMGIDIGTLNTAYNNSVPPLPGNFLQRIGRAGRESGAAVVINFAQNKAHDLFFFQDPNEMMAGKINSPGCYLEAREILRRHFFAYCIDSWTTDNSKLNSIPAYVGFLKLETLDLSSSELFINRILSYVKNREQALFDRFCSQYPSLSRALLEELRKGFQNESFYEAHRRPFQRLKDELLDLNQKKIEIDERIRTQKLGKEDPERLELEREKKNLGGIAGSIKKRSTLEHLTNVGLLPNYAFPETGVTLMGRVSGQTATQSTKPPLDKDFEIVRSAGQALRELSPDNTFYSQGFRFKITGVNTFDWSDGGNFHKKRFCSNCDHIDLAAVAPAGHCPKCGSESWNAASNTHQFARLRTVKSFNQLADATLNDARDERDQTFFTSQRHFCFDQNSTYGAWAMQEIPFGIEFFKNVTVIDTNLGRTDTISSRRIKINDQEVAASGFITCRYCGKSSSSVHEITEKPHYGFCKHKTQTYKGIADEVFDEVYFFKDMTTECLRILLPVQEFNSEAEIEMFRSGMELGLRQYYRGNPQHISFSHYREYNHKLLKFDRYLVLYDTVPGGTGYLEKLFDWQEFNKLLVGAYEAIRDCSCQHHGKDGCYHCIYSYGNQYTQGELSRSRAEKRFEEIVRKSEGWEKYPYGLGSITNSGQIEESELELRFVRSLQKFAQNQENWTFSQSHDEGVVVYHLVYDRGETRFCYLIRPQVELGPAQGVEYHTRADFVILCPEATLNGEKLDLINTHGIPRIAVYLDGYQYHASPENNRFANDLQKRMSINRSQQYTTWTLTWEDLDRFDEMFLEKNLQTHRTDFLSVKFQEEGFRDTKKKLLLNAKNLGIPVHEARNSLERLLKFLEYPLRSEAFSYDWTTFLGLFQARFLVPSYPPELTYGQLATRPATERYCLDQKTLNGWVRFQGVEENRLFSMASFVNLHQKQVTTGLDIRETTNIDKGLWNQFWAVYNCVQFFPLHLKAPSHETPEAERADETVPEAQEPLLNLYEAELHPLLRRLLALNLLNTEQDEIGLNALLDAEGNEIAGAKLILNTIRVAIDPYSAEEERVFLHHGYTIKSISDLNGIDL